MESVFLSNFDPDRFYVEFLDGSDAWESSGNAHFDNLIRCNEILNVNEIYYSDNAITPYYDTEIEKHYAVRGKFGTEQNKNNGKGWAKDDAVDTPQGELKSVFDTAKALCEDSIRPEEIPPMRVVQYDDAFYSLDNRRLWAFRNSGTRLVSVIVQPTPKNFRQMIRLEYRVHVQVCKPLQDEVDGELVNPPKALLSEDEMNYTPEVKKAVKELRTMTDGQRGSNVNANGAESILDARYAVQMGHHGNKDKTPTSVNMRKTAKLI